MTKAASIVSITTKNFSVLDSFNFILFYILNNLSFRYDTLYTDFSISSKVCI
jgi:hypothetical protein